MTLMSQQYELEGLFPRAHNSISYGLLRFISFTLFFLFLNGYYYQYHTVYAGGRATMHAYISIVTAADIESRAFVVVFQQRVMLQAMGSTLPHVLVAVGFGEQHKPLIDTFRGCGFDVREHEDIPIRYAADVQLMSGRYTPLKKSSGSSQTIPLHDSYNNIAAWRQTDVTKGILLDKHVLIRSNLDDLASEAPFTGAYDYPPLEMNTAVFIIEPNDNVYESMLQFITQPLSNTGDGTFQGFVNAFVRERHFLLPFTLGDMRYSLLNNPWGDEQVKSGTDVRFKPSIIRAFAFVDDKGRPQRAPWAAAPFGAFSPDLLRNLKQEFASGMAFAIARYPILYKYLSQSMSLDFMRDITNGARPFRPTDHRAFSPLGCHPAHLDNDRTRSIDLGDGVPQAQSPASSQSVVSYSLSVQSLGKKAYASVLVGTRDVNALMMQHQLLLWTNTTVPHIVVCLGLPKREVERLRRAGMHPIVFRETPFADRHAGFNKLFLFNLTQFSKLIFLDADAWPLKNVDFMFSYPGIAGAPDNFIVNEFNTGVMVIEPHAGLFDHLVKMYKLYIRWEIGWGTDGTDQGFLNSVCATWFPLPFSLNYRFFRNFSSPLYHDTRELFYLKHRMEDIAIVHTYTFVKPYLLPSWVMTDTADPEVPPDMRYEYPPIFDGVVRKLWRAWVISKRRWGHRAQELPKA